MHFVLIIVINCLSDNYLLSLLKILNMKECINLNFNYAEQLLKIRDAAFRPYPEEYFQNLILSIRRKIYDYITSDKEKKYIAYIISIEIATIIDYIYCISEGKDTYPCERILEKYGYKIEDLLDNEIFKYIFD